jgi:hypothetical protein
MLYLEGAWLAKATEELGDKVASRKSGASVPRQLLRTRFAGFSTTKPVPSPQKTLPQRTEAVPSNFVSLDAAKTAALPS